MSPDEITDMQLIDCEGRRCARSSIRRILPVSVFGRSSTNSIRAGRRRREAARGRTLDLVGQLVGGLVALGEDDERLDDVAAALVGRGDRGRLAHRRVLDAGGLDLERPDPVAGGDDHVVGAARVPVVAVLVRDGGVLGVEPLAAERLLGRLVVVPVAERVVRVRARAQADLAALAGPTGCSSSSRICTSQPGIGLPIEPSRTSMNG
jgi:hypothetical protein